ncbi:hypothetical protein LCGC14_2500480 [marine sediment metagenome]|uniref:Uncharacterized protein n=1 Tax=marine sediment metagenome TaxID=412755 RepID=A0A0F9DVS7_9ZZZZ
MIIAYTVGVIMGAAMLGLGLWKYRVKKEVIFSPFLAGAGLGLILVSIVELVLL